MLIASPLAKNRISCLLKGSQEGIFGDQTPQAGGWTFCARLVATDIFYKCAPKKVLLNSL